MHLLNSSSFFILNLSLSLTSWSTSQLEKRKFDVEIQETMNNYAFVSNKK